jgi:tetratricopeptide (TPR) repeat protein
MSSGVTDLDSAALRAFVRLSVEVTESGSFIELPVHRAVLAASESEFTAAERHAWDLSALEAINTFWLDPSTRLPPDLRTRRALCALFVRLAEALGDTAELHPGAVADAAMALASAELSLDHYEAAAEAALRGVDWAGRSTTAVLIGALLQLATVYRSMQELTQSERAAQRALSLIDGSENLAPFRSEVERAIALVRNDLGDYQAALVGAERALDAAVDTRDRIAALRVMSLVRDNRGGDGIEPLTEALELARGLQPADVALVVGLETDLTGLEPFPGTPERWREHADLAERELGVGHWLHRYCLDSLAISLAMSSLISEAAQVVDELLQLSSDSDRAPFSQVFLGAMTTGRLDALADAFPDEKYLPPRTAEAVRAVMSLGHISATSPAASDGTTNEQTDSLWLLNALKTDANSTLTEVADRVASDPQFLRGYDEAAAVGMIIGALDEFLIVAGEPHPESPRLLTYLHEVTADGAFPS